MTRYSPRWYDRDGNEISIEQANALLADIDARRVAFDDFGVAHVSTVLLVLDHSWDGGPPLIFETMTFLGDAESDFHVDVDCERTSTETAALAAHDRACAVVRDAKARFDAELDVMQKAQERDGGEQ